jgi:hypothetical protein
MLQKRDDKIRLTARVRGCNKKDVLIFMKYVPENAIQGRAKCPISKIFEDNFGNARFLRRKSKIMSLNLKI